MRKGALKKKRRQLEELHLDRREALGELVLGMYVQGTWDDEIMSRGAAEVREVAMELESLSSPEAPGPELQAKGESAEFEMPPTGEHTAEHDMPETAEHTGAQDLPDVGPETGEHTGEQPAAAAVADEAEADPRQEKPGDDAESPAGKASGSDREQEPAADEQTAKAETATKPEGTPTGPKPVTGGEGEQLPFKAGAGTRPAQAAAQQEKVSELDRMAERIAKTEQEAKTASDAARAAVAADARTELSAITREIESDRSKLDAALKEAAARIEDAEKRAAAAEAKLARESAANREAAADWVRSQAAEIEADAAIAAEIAADSGQERTGADDEGRPQLEARIRALETALEAEKASKAEALTVAESRLKAIEESAREAEKRVEEAEAAVSEAGTAPVSVGAAPGVVTEAEAREAAVNWLRGQIGALRQEIAKGPAQQPGEES